jgi:glutaredoxin 2
VLASEVTLFSILRRYCLVKGCGFDARLIVFGDDRYTWWRISWMNPK